MPFNRQNLDQYNRKFAPLHAGHRLRDEVRAATRELARFVAETGDGSDYAKTAASATSKQKDLLEALVADSRDMQEAVEFILNTLIERAKTYKEETENT